MSSTMEFTLTDQAVSVLNRASPTGGRWATAFGLLLIAAQGRGRFPKDADWDMVSALCYLRLLRHGIGNEFSFIGGKEERERLLGLSIDPQTGNLIGIVTKP